MCSKLFLERLDQVDALGQVNVSLRSISTVKMILIVFVLMQYTFSSSPEVDRFYNSSLRSE
jgi:hypothetical protein